MTELAHLGWAVNGGRYALLGAGILYHRDHRRILGFGGIATTAASIAQILFFVFLVIFLVALVMGVAGRRRPPI
jgi:uncharacterized membrane protein YtjA (UPF0391 family)